jgi:hypothetical protein
VCAWRSWAGVTLPVFTAGWSAFHGPAVRPEPGGCWGVTLHVQGPPLAAMAWAAVCARIH